MEYIVIGICLIAIVSIGARIFFKPKSKATVTPTVSVSPKEDEELSLSAPQGESAHDVVIQVEMLPAEAISEEGSLVEITDSKVLARVNNLIPNWAQAGNAVNNAVQAVEAQGEVLYAEAARIRHRNAITLFDDDQPLSAVVIGIHQTVGQCFTQRLMH